MKKLITVYSFDPTTSTITLTDLGTIALEQYLLITNTTDNIIIYNFAVPTLGGTVSNNSIILNYDTSSMSAGDSLQIFIDIDNDVGIGLSSINTPRMVLASDQPAIPVSLSYTIPSVITTTGYASSLIIKATSGTLFSLTGFNSSNMSQFIHIFDSSSLPVDGSTPKVIFYVTPKSNFSFDLGQFGRPFTTGIIIANSTTGPIKNIGADDCWFDVLYQ